MSDPRVTLAATLSAAAGEQAVAALDAVRPVIRLGADLDPQAATAAGSLYSMLCRLFPHTVIEGDATMGLNPWCVASLAALPRALTRARSTPTRAPERDLVIGVGPEVTGATLWMGGSEWTADVGRAPRPINGGRFGIGPLAGAIFVAAEVSRIVFPQTKGIVSFGDGLIWNLLNYQMDRASHVEMGELSRLRVAFLAAGSVNSSAVGVLTCLTGLTGDADVVDFDTFNPARNPYRYPASSGAESGPKANWVAAMLTQAGWNTWPFGGSVGDWVRSRPQPGFDGIVVSSVDRVDGRAEVADVLAATTLSVGVDGLALHLQREHVLDEYECPYCEYASLDPPASEIDRLAQLVGLPPDRVGQLHLGGDVLSEHDVEVAIAVGRIHSERARELVGRRLDDLINRAYAETTVATTGGEPARVSAPYVSQMGGLLLASELLKVALGLPMVDRRVNLDLSGIPLGVVRRRLRDTNGNCICASPLRRRWAADLYGGPWNHQSQHAGLTPPPQTRPGQPFSTSMRT